jgi:hypothetical protein
VSRIILKQFNDDEPQIVVGWDRPCASFFWQEFNKEPVIEQSGEGKWKVISPAFAKGPREYDSQGEAEHHKWDGWQEMVRFAGYEPNELPTLTMFRDSLPPDIRGLVNEQVIAVLNEHTMDPDPGRIIVNMVPRSYKVEVQTFGETKWSSNGIRFATNDEANRAGVDLSMRWTMVEHWRVAPSDDPVNYKWEDGKAVSV